jgi:DNA polymerase-4
VEPSPTNLFDSLDPQDNPLRSLFLDLNSYFASVEQQLNPALRGKPIAVTPVLADGGCCVAASYEAKKFGVRTGTRVGEAKRLCPGIQFVKTQHRVYVQMHHKIIEAVETCIPVEQVMSIDEMSCRLARDEREPARAVDLALKIKRAIASRVGECMRCSIGIAPNRFLAKVGTDMQKPDGLVVIESHELPHKLLGLSPQDLPGIGNRMAANLRRVGIDTVEDLCAQTEAQMERAWGGVVGRYWYRWLRGGETPQRKSRTRSIGHQHVLPPDARNAVAAWGITVRLLHKAAARMRHLGYYARRLSLAIGFVGQRRGPWGSLAESNPENRAWSQGVLLEGGKQDTMTLVAELRKLWDQRPDLPPGFVGVTLHELLPATSVTQPLFPQEQRREELSRLIDELDASHGPLTVYTASMHEARDRAAGGIAFRSVPDLDLPDTVV